MQVVDGNSKAEKLHNLFYDLLFNFDDSWLMLTRNQQQVEVINNFYFYL
jgi:hypothetical protein